MSGLKGTVQRFINVSSGKGWKRNADIRAEKAAKIQGAKDKLFAGAEIPDEEEVARNERRKAAKRQGSRANTVLTDQDTLG